VVDSVGRAGLPAAGPLAQLLDVWRHGGRRINWDRVAGVIYDKFDGELASYSLTYVSARTVRYQW